MKKKYLLYIMALLLALQCLSGCGSEKETSSPVEETPATEETPEPTPEPSPEPTPEPVQTVSFMAVGDNIIYTDGTKQASNGVSYNFDFIYANITDFVKQFDVAAINQETVMVDIALGDYPTFGVPKAVGDSVVYAGFNVMTNATNHSYDWGVQGIQSSLDFYKVHPQVTYLGINRTQEEYDEVVIKEYNGIRIALLNYSYGLDTSYIPVENRWMMDRLDDEEKLISDLDYAEENADITIAFIHWGSEYQLTESDSQHDYAQLFADHGCDIIIGSHPHVIEPVKYVTGENGNPCLVYYSMGNFTSSQSTKETMLGGVACINIQKQGDTVTLQDSAFYPCVNYYDYATHTTYFLKDYTEDMAHSATMHGTPEYYWDLWNQVNDASEIYYPVSEETWQDFEPAE